MMYSQVADRQVITEAAVEYSQAVSMEGANVVLVEAICFHLTTAAQVELTVQESNDLENWETLGNVTILFRDEGYGEMKETGDGGLGIAAQYVRIRYIFEADVHEGPAAILAVGINTADL